MMYTTIRLLLLISPFIFSLFCHSNFQLLICLSPQIRLLRGYSQILWQQRSSFTHFEPSQSEGRAKMGDRRENHLTTCKQNLACLTCDPR